MPAFDSALEIQRRGELPPDEQKIEALRLFLDGHNANHVAFLMHYKMKAGDVCDVVREALLARIVFETLGALSEG